MKPYKVAVKRIRTDYTTFTVHAKSLQEAEQAAKLRAEDSYHDWCDIGEIKYKIEQIEEQAE